MAGIRASKYSVLYVAKMGVCGMNMTVLITSNYDAVTFRDANGVALAI